MNIGLLLSGGMAKGALQLGALCALSEIIPLEEIICSAVYFELPLAVILFIGKSTVSDRITPTNISKTINSIKPISIRRLLILR